MHEQNKLLTNAVGLPGYKINHVFLLMLSQNYVVFLQPLHTSIHNLSHNYNLLFLLILPMLTAGFLNNSSRLCV